MTLLFLFAAGLTIAGAVAALALRNLIHCALAAVGAFVGLALLFVELGAQFVGLAQILVNVGAVAILILQIPLFFMFQPIINQAHQPGDQWSYQISHNDLRQCPVRLVINSYCQGSD